MLKIDLHIHTIASGHAHNTILEYINQAKKLKMKVIGISDHGTSPADSIVSDAYFRCIKRIPKKINGVRILKGIEANIINKKGEVDVSDRAINKLDYVMANFHLDCGYNDQGKKINTMAMIKVIRSGKVKIITHPEFIKDFDIDLEEVSREACKNDVLLEINLSHLASKIQSDTILNMKKIVNIARKMNKKIIVGSDSHNIWELGDDTNLKKYKKEIGLTDSMIINNYPKELFKLLKINEK